MKKILIVDNDTRYATQLTNKLMETIETKPTLVSEFDIDYISENLNNFDIFIIRFHSDTKKIIKLLSDEEKIVVVLTHRDSDDIIKEIQDFDVSDYIITNQTTNTDNACSVLNRLILNSKLHVLVVEDSQLSLDKICMLLTKQGIPHTNFQNGAEVWEYIQKHTDVDLIIADYIMPKMDGYELTKKIRAKHSFEELPILILSATKNTQIIARFLKAGANDYIPKPFIHEEFIARVSNTLNTLEMFRKIKKAALIDYLTGLNNRTFLYESGNKIIKIMQRNKTPISLGICDIDNFKQINDTYGHSFGDTALKLVATAIKDSVRDSDLCARFGGEEFVYLLADCKSKDAIEISEKIRKSVEDIKLEKDGQKIPLTISIGLTSKIDTLQNMINQADEYLYKAKHNGKNQVIYQ